MRYVSFMHCRPWQQTGKKRVTVSLLIFFQVLKVGVTETRYVGLKHCRPWVIHAYRNIKGRGFHKEEETEGSNALVRKE